MTFRDWWTLYTRTMARSFDEPFYEAQNAWNAAVEACVQQIRCEWPRADFELRKLKDTDEQ